MSENKVKLQLSRNLSSDKNLSPTKLMINHGKPNFTINRQNSNYKKYHIDTEIKPNEIDNVVLKNVTQSADKENFNTNNKNINNDHEFVEKFNKISLKTSEKKQQNTIKSGQIAQKQEFLEKFREISDKLSTRDIDAIETPSLDNNIANDNSTNGNSVYNMKPYASQLKASPECAKIVDNRLQNADINKSGFKLPPGAICGKPYIPAKPAGLIPCPVSPVIISNGNDNINGHSIKSIATIKNEINCQDDTTTGNGGAKFEQKTVVSFSKDLSAAPNTYPDTAIVVKNAVINEMKTNFEKHEISNEMGQLKFDIETAGNDIIVKPVIR